MVFFNHTSLPHISPLSCGGEFHPLPATTQQGFLHDREEHTRGTRSLLTDPIKYRTLLYIVVLKIPFAGRSRPGEFPAAVGVGLRPSGNPHRRARDPPDIYG